MCPCRILSVSRRLPASSFTVSQLVHLSLSRKESVLDSPFSLPASFSVTTDRCEPVSTFSTVSTVHIFSAMPIFHSIPLSHPAPFTPHRPFPPLSPLAPHLATFAGARGAARYGRHACENARGLRASRKSLPPLSSPS